MGLVSQTGFASNVLQKYDAAISVESYNLKAPTGIALTDFEILGQPVKLNGSNMEFVQDTDEANAEGIVIADEKITVATAGVTTNEYAVLVRGPARLNEAGFPANDCNGDAFTIATLVTAYKGLGDIIVVDEQPKSFTQTT